MALYRHVRNKDALLDGVVEKLWDEVPAPPRRHDGWTEPLRSFAFALRAAISNHPRAATLLLTRPVLLRRPLEAFDTLLANIRDAGYDDEHATQILRSVIATAYTDAFAGLTYRCVAGTAATAPSDTDTLITLTQLLPPDTPPHLVRTAHAIYGVCQPATDFTYVLDLILTGADTILTGADTLERRQPPRGETAPSI
jgi:AcrR family transcriptional regulator